MRWLRTLLFVLLVGCGTTPTVEGFCDQAVPALTRNDLGSEPGDMLGQVEEVERAIDMLPDDQSSEVRAQVDDLRAQLDRAVRGEADNGWSNSDLVDAVASLCGEGDMISWTVQP